MHRYFHLVYNPCPIEAQIECCPGLPTLDMSAQIKSRFRKLQCYFGTGREKLLSRQAREPHTNHDYEKITVEYLDAQVGSLSYMYHHSQGNIALVYLCCWFS